MNDATLPLPGLSPLGRTSIVARFDGGSLSSNAGVLVLREVETRLGVADRLAGCLDDPRNPDLIVHGLADMIRFRMLMIASGYEDANDAAALRLDPVFKMARGRCRPDATSPLSRRSRGWKTCPTRTPCCAWGVNRCEVLTPISAATT